MLFQSLERALNESQTLGLPLISLIFSCPVPKPESDLDPHKGWEGGKCFVSRFGISLEIYSPGAATPRHLLPDSLIGTLHPRPQVENLSMSLAGVCD